jgi:methylmalonyl-CoA/ethylmalonyl-CoA epimerase
MHIHHVNVLVRDLDEAVSRYERLLDQPVAARESLPARGVETARFALGGAWLVLVQPVRADSEPARYLAEHGEGLFLLSLAVESLVGAEARLGPAAFSGPERSGLDGWRIRDLDPAGACGVQLQFTEAG